MRSLGDYMLEICEQSQRYKYANKGKDNKKKPAPKAEAGKGKGKSTQSGTAPGAPAQSQMDPAVRNALISAAVGGSGGLGLGYLMGAKSPWEYMGYGAGGAGLGAAASYLPGAFPNKAKEAAYRQKLAYGYIPPSMLQAARQSAAQPYTNDEMFGEPGQGTYPPNPEPKYPIPEYTEQEMFGEPGQPVYRPPVPQPLPPFAANIPGMPSHPLLDNALNAPPQYGGLSPDQIRTQEWLQANDALNAALQQDMQAQQGGGQLSASAAPSGGSLLSGGNQYLDQFTGPPAIPSIDSQLAGTPASQRLPMPPQTTPQQQPWWDNQNVHAAALGAGIGGLGGLGLGYAMGADSPWEYAGYGLGGAGLGAGAGYFGSAAMNALGGQG